MELNIRNSFFKLNLQILSYYYKWLFKITSVNKNDDKVNTSRVLSVMSQETRFKEASESNTSFEDMFHRLILDSERTDLCEIGNEEIYS